MKQPPTHCPECFHMPWTNGPCPKCGFEHDPDVFPSALAAGTSLSKYGIGRVLGRPGGFGITYLAFDSVLQRKVAIKELMPRDLVGRRHDGATLTVHTRADEGVFRATLTSFLNEARMIAQFSHPNVVRVLDYFEANGTAYFAMEYYQGETLAERVSRSGGRIAADEAVAFMLPVLDALQHIHSLPEPILHRDIKPQNIYLAGKKTPILLDFGAARVSLGRQSRSLSTVLTPGFAPYEQYSSRGDQGPWSDVYGCAATLHYLVTGQAPPDAADRLDKRDIPPPSQLVTSLPQYLSDAIVQGLAFSPDTRPRSAVAFADLISGRSTVAPTRTAVTVTPATTLQVPTALPTTLQSPTMQSPTMQAPVTPQPHRRQAALLAVAAVFVLAVVSGAVAFMRSGSPQEPRLPQGLIARQPDNGPTLATNPLDKSPGPVVVETKPNKPAPPAPGRKPLVEPPDHNTAPPPSHPATGVLVVIYGDDVTSARHAESAVLRSLIGQHGLTPMDPSGLSMIKKVVDPVKAANAGDLATLAQVGRAHGLELLVVGSLTARGLPSVGQFYTGTAELDLKMYRMSTGGLVEADVFRVGGGGAQPVLEITDAEARSRASEAAGKLAADAMEQWLRQAFP